MVEQRSRKIIKVALLNSYQGWINILAYALTIGSIATSTKAVADEWDQYNVKVNAIVPGYIAPDINTALINYSDRSRQIIERIPTGS